MVTYTKIEIQSPSGEPLPNTFQRQDGPAKQLAVMFPGAEYTVQMPALYYPGRLLVEAGADLLQVEYNYRQWEGLTEAERFRQFYGTVSAALDAGLSQRDYARVTLAGKSVGTLAVAYLLTERSWPYPPACIWLTPLLRSDRLRERITRMAHPALFVIGSADRHYKPDLLSEVQAATGGEALVIPGADHSLEIPGDVPASLQAMGKIVTAVQAFLNDHG